MSINICHIDLGPIVKQHLHHFSMYDFLWKDDLNASYLEFMKSDPGIGTIEREVFHFYWLTNLLSL